MTNYTEDSVSEANFFLAQHDIEGKLDTDGDYYDCAGGYLGLEKIKWIHVAGTLLVKEKSND